MKLFVTGVGGQLGHDVVNESIKRGYDVVGSDIGKSSNMSTIDRKSPAFLQGSRI